MKDRALIGGVVALAVAALACVTFLVAIGRDPTAVMTAVGLVVVPTLGALVYGRLDRIESNTNGSQSALLALVDKLTTGAPPQTPPGAVHQVPAPGAPTPDGEQ